MKFFLIIFSCHVWCLAASQPPIGLWREHLPYNSAIDVTAGDGKVYCATPYSLFSVTINGNLIERHSRVTGLNETGISTIRYDESSQKLFIAYSNSNIDIIYRNDIYNVPDIRRSTIAGDKQVYNIHPLGDFFYLSTGLGIIIVDGEKYEVKDTWFIGQGGNAVKVTGFTTAGGSYYAATTEGLKKLPAGSTNPADHNNWLLESGSNGLPAGPSKNVMNIGGKIVVEINDSLFAQNGSAWSLFYTGGWPVTSTNVSEDNILVCERQQNGPARVIILNADGTIAREISNSGAVSFPRKAIVYNSDPWVADQFACLSHFGSTPAYEQYMLNSPQGVATGEMVVYNRIFYATAGSVNDAWNYQFNGDGVFRFKEGTWSNMNRYHYPQLDSMLDFVTVAIDPLDETVWAGSYGGGLLHIKAGPDFEIYKQAHLGATVGDPASYRVAGLVFDKEENLWISNFGSAQPLKVRKRDGSWQGFSLPFPLFENALGPLIVDDNNYKWIVSPLGNGLICFDHGADVGSINDDRWRKLGAGPGNGGLPNSDVVCIAKDRNGYIWVGTTDGIGVVQCPQEIFTANGCDAILPIVPNGNFAGYLFKGQEVRHIAVDGADRKWVATKSGVFLISPEGDKVISQFTAENSPLLANDVKKIAIDAQTGEVFFATLNGICSYRGTSTDGELTSDNIKVFPNPVPPGFSGIIGISGLENNAIVKITELDGRLVFQTRALGGQAVWHGKNYRGERISSGVYLVLVSGDNMKERAAGKIFFISK